MATPAYTDTKGRKITQTAYDAQKKSGIDVSWYKPISTTPIATPAPQQNLTDITTEDTTPVAGITDAMKATDTYKNLLSKWFTEAQIGESFANKTKLWTTPLLTPTATQPTEKTTQPEPTPTTTTDTTDTTDTDISTANIDTNLDYQTSNYRRLWEIKQHLEDAYATNPWAFTTYDKFKTDYNYNGRSSDQRKILDAFYNSKVWPKNDTFGSMTETEISDAYMGGTLTDSDLLNLKTLDPAKWQLAQTAISNAKTYWDANNSLSGKLESMRKQLGITAPDDTSLEDKYNEYVNTPEINTLSQSLATKQWEIDLIDQQIADMSLTIDKQYEWTGMTQDVIDAIVADRTEALTRDRARKAIWYNTELSKYNSLYKSGTDQYQAYKDEIAQNRQERQDTMSQLGFYYESTPEGMADVAKAKAKLEPIEVQTKDFGTTKKPDWRQSFDGGKTWVKMDWFGGTGWGGTVIWTKMWWDIVSLLKEYKTILDGSWWAALQLNPTQKGKLTSLKSQITAIYKQKQKLGTLDNWVINLMNWLLWDAWLFSPTHYSNTAQSSAVNDLINRWSSNTAYVWSTNNWKNIKVDTTQPTVYQSTIPSTTKKNVDLWWIFKNIFKFEMF